MTGMDIRKPLIECEKDTRTITLTIKKTSVVGISGSGHLPRHRDVT